jgi:hypothetical protein
MDQKAWRVSMYLKDDDYQVIKKFAEKQGMSFSRACAYAARLGVTAMKLAFSPEMKQVYENQINEIE